MSKEAASPKYRAFLSYSHRDREWGDWLHPALERYQIPRDLKDRQGRLGTLPASLRPIFRDRADLEAGHSLTEQVDAALKASDAMIVMCSPDSAKSPYVNEEIRRFKAMGRGKRIYPIIVRGEPGDAANECFPNALRKKVDALGQLAGDDEEPIAADAREHGDGKDLAMLKLAAGLLGVELDELRKREAIEAKRRQRRTALVAGLMSVLAITAGISAVYAFQQRHEAVVARDLAEERRLEAENRYRQALRSTLRLVTTAATLRTIMEGTNFGINQIESKGENDDFLNFLHSAKEPNEIWFQLSQVLMSYHYDLPPELRHYRQRLEKGGLRLQWATHAEVIMANIVRRGHAKPEYKAQLDQVRERIKALGGEPSKDCVTATASAAIPGAPPGAPNAPMNAVPADGVFRPGDVVTPQGFLPPSESLMPGDMINTPGAPAPPNAPALGPASDMAVQHQTPPAPHVQMQQVPSHDLKTMQRPLSLENAGGLPPC